MSKKKHEPCPFCNQYIERLQNQLKKHQWVSAIEDPPEIGEEVFLTMGINIFIGRRLDNCYFGPGLTEEVSKKITHWKLIILPNDEEEEDE